LSAAGPDFIVLTGFLGSGKTTLLRDLLIHPEASDTAVIVNEVGEIGLDGVILREGVGDVPISMLANGCICCQMSSDLAITIDLLLTAPRPPGAPPLRAEHRMAVGVVATFDVTRGIALCAFEEAVAQWAAANRVVMTKTDLVEPQAWQITHNDMFGLNPLAEIIATRTRSEAVQAAFAPLRGVSPVPDRARIPLTATHARIGLCLIRPTGIPAYDDVATWLDNLAGALGERLLRIKGILSVAEGTSPLLFQSVGTVFSQPRPIRSAGETTEPFLVVIVRDAEEQEIALVAPAGVFAAEFRSLAS
jgi:G3E family GTPase